MLYLCLPAYNEGPTVGLVLWNIHKVFSSYSREYEILVVNDGSDDSTAETLESYAQLLPLTIITHERRLGYGAALDSLSRAAAERTKYPRRDAAIFMQADFSDPPEALPEIIKRFEGGADLVVAEADREPQALPSAIRWIRRFAPRMLRPMLKLDQVQDPLGSFRLARISVIRDALRECGSAPLVSGAGWAASSCTAQQEEPPRSVEHTPVSGSTSSTARAPAKSPVSAQTTERTCSYPVSSRKVGARP